MCICVCMFFLYKCLSFIFCLSVISYTVSKMADTIFYGGEIITMDEKRPGKVEAVAVTGDTIIEVGSIEAAFQHKGPNTKLILLNGQTLMPGFIEPHQHAIMCCMKRAMYTDISGVKYL